ncbi:MAG: imidazole glycerol phosphate synthase subunit HisH [Bacteroidetes bacterium]|nr:imidazole glycerol phosphate synthase subunit HisH [Bacteroidota bacterium]
MITIINYGMGNLASVQNMLKRIGTPCEITSDLDKISKAKKILLPGVGAFDAAIERIDAAGFREVLNTKALQEKVPVLGICLGLQLLTESSEEGKLKGLGWIPAKTLKFNFPQPNNLKVPHMGWDEIHVVNQSALLSDLPAEPRFYFVHSYHAKADADKYVLARTTYGYEFDSVITNGDNIFGAQFHPEKSHKFGMKLLDNFSKM